jgi:hypothetical protein
MEQNLLQEFERKIELYEGMLIETGGHFGRGKLGGDKYVDKCLISAINYLTESGRKEELFIIIDKFINEYESQKAWKYYDMEMSFLYGLKKGLLEKM